MVLIAAASTALAQDSTSMTLVYTGYWGYLGFLWSSTESPPYQGRVFYLSYDVGNILSGGYRKEWGSFVRCLRD